VWLGLQCFQVAIDFPDVLAAPVAGWKTAAAIGGVGEVDRDGGGGGVEKPVGCVVVGGHLIDFSVDEHLADGIDLGLSQWDGVEYVKFFGVEYDAVGPVLHAVEGGLEWRTIDHAASLTEIEVGEGSCGWREGLLLLHIDEGLGLVDEPLVHGFVLLCLLEFFEGGAGVFDILGKALLGFLRAGLGIDLLLELEDALIFGVPFFGVVDDSGEVVEASLGGCLQIVVESSLVFEPDDAAGAELPVGLDAVGDGFEF